MENISSEEQLLQLRDEGKISEDEYKDLLSAMRKRSENTSSTSNQVTHEPKFRAFQRWVLIGGMIICWIGIPLGFVFGLPIVWGLSIFGIVAIGIKMHILSK